MRVLVFGGTGFVGPHVVRLLAEGGHDVTIFHRGETETVLPEEVRHLHGSFDALPLERLRALRPQVVVDMVPFVRGDAGRIHSFAGVAERAVAVSSGDVYRAFGRLWRTEPGPPEPLPLTEDSPLREVVIDPTYDKVGVEQELLCDGRLPTAILRAPAIHGPADEQRRLRDYVRRMADARPVIVLDKRIARWRWTRGYVENVAAAIALAAERAPAEHRVYNVADPVTHTEAEWVRCVAGAFGWSGEVLPASPAVLPEYLRRDGLDFRQDLVVDTSCIRGELGYDEPVPEDEGLRRTIEWELAQPDDGEQRDYAAEDRAANAAR